MNLQISGALGDPPPSFGSPWPGLLGSSASVFRDFCIRLHLQKAFDNLTAFENHLSRFLFQFCLLMLTSISVCSKTKDLRQLYSNVHKALGYFSLLPNENMRTKGK